MTDMLFVVANGSIHIMSTIVVVTIWSTMNRWIIQLFEKMINIMDVGHFSENHE